MNTQLTEEQERSSLQYDPFEGDETDVSRLADKFVKARKQHECFHCRDVIEPGERHRAKTERNNEERKIMTFRFCAECCRTFALSWDDYEPMMERYRQGRAVDNARHVMENEEIGCTCYLCVCSD